uniref:Uncharacterized protein n=1 Tax=Arundo donax TaxID=35708 RepID=A0A0A9FTZ1_ARUDO
MNQRFCKMFIYISS